MPGKAFSNRLAVNRLIGIAWLLAGLIMAQSVLANIMSAEVMVGDELPSPDGRLHLWISGGLATPAPVLVTDVQLNDDMLEIVLDSTVAPTPVISGFSLLLVVDGVPPGEYAGTIFATMTFNDPEDKWQVGEFTFEVADPLRQRVPMPVRFWPDSPTIFDELWLLVDPVHTCSEVEVDIPFHISGIELHESNVVCTEDELPRTRAFPLGRMEELSTRAHVRYLIDDELANRTRIGLEVRDALTSRMIGSWYNPDESGHGLNLEVLDDATLLAYWFTFDPFGELYWLIAMGAYQGEGLVVLDAWTAEGGAFPPQFDPALIEIKPWGMLEIEFASCTEAELRWMPEADGFEAGEMPLVRLSGAADHNCLDPPPESLLVPAWFKNADFYFRLDD